MLDMVGSRERGEVVAGSRERAVTAGRFVMGKRKRHHESLRRMSSRTVQEQTNFVKSRVVFSSGVGAVNNSIWTANNSVIHGQIACMLG